MLTEIGMPEDDLTYTAHIRNAFGFGSKLKRAFPTDSEDSSTGPASALDGRKQLKLHVEIPTSTIRDELETKRFSSLSPDSLFDEVLEFPDSQYESLGLSASTAPAITPTLSKPALRTAPPIPGLFFDPSMRLPETFADEIVRVCMGRYFDGGDVNGGRRVNQIMLFERAKERSSNPTSTVAHEATSNNPSFPSSTASTGLPPILMQLLETLSRLLQPPVVPPEIHELLFSSVHSADSNPPSVATVTHGLARQAILNLYAHGEGISPHVDLLRRFGDGIIGVSLCGGCVMRFEKVWKQEEKDDDEAVPQEVQNESDFKSNSEIHDVYLPKNSIIILTGDARYKWTHGIEERYGDWVKCEGEEFSQVKKEGTALGEIGGKGGKDGVEEAEWIPRDTRLSITFRWLLPGADIVGGD